jgi:hypothetical protein
VVEHIEAIAASLLAHAKAPWGKGHASRPTHSPLKREDQEETPDKDKERTFETKKNRKRGTEERA